MTCTGGQSEGRSAPGLHPHQRRDRGRPGAYRRDRKPRRRRPKGLLPSDKKRPIQGQGAARGADHHAELARSTAEVHPDCARVENPACTLNPRLVCSDTIHLLNPKPCPDHLHCSVDRSCNKPRNPKPNALSTLSFSHLSGLCNVLV